MSARWQRTKIKLSFSSWSELPQGSVAEPILFNMSINDFFYFLTCHICNFADETTSCVCNSSLELLSLKSWKNILHLLWSGLKLMKWNWMQKKCHLFISGNKYEQMWAKIRDEMVWEFRTVNPLSANTTKWPNTFKQFVGNTRRIVWVCLTILRGWHLKG